MKEILDTIPFWLEIKDTIDFLIDYIPVFAASAAIGAVLDIPGTIRTIRNVADKITDIIEWIRAGRD